MIVNILPSTRNIPVIDFHDNGALGKRIAISPHRRHPIPQDMSNFAPPDVRHAIELQKSQKPMPL